MASINRLVLAWFLIVAAFLVCCKGDQNVSKPSTSPKLVVGTKHVPPFVIKRPDGSWDGISIELWEQITHELNLDYEICELTLEELLGGLENQSLDVAVAALTVTSQREQIIDFTHPFHTTGLGIAVSSKNKAGWFAVIKQFLSVSFLKVLVALTGVLFVAGFLVWLFERRYNREQFGGTVPKGLVAGFWWSAVTMTTVGYGDKAPKTMAGRLVALVWMFTSVIIISSFTAAITSTLTVNRLELKVNGPEDLPRVRVGTVKDSTSRTYLKQQRILFETYDDPVLGLQAVAEGNLDAFVYDAPVMRYLISIEFDRSLQVLPNTFERQYYAIGLQQGGPLRESINRILIEKISQPQWQDVLEKYLGQ